MDHKSHAHATTPFTLEFLHAQTVQKKSTRADKTTYFSAVENFEILEKKAVKDNLDKSWRSAARGKSELVGAQSTTKDYKQRG